MQDVVKIRGEEHVILEQRGSIFNPKFVGRSIKDGKIHNIKLTRKGLVNHYLELAKSNFLLFSFFHIVYFYI